MPTLKKDPRADEFFLESILGLIADFQTQAKVETSREVQ